MTTDSLAATSGAASARVEATDAVHDTFFDAEDDNGWDTFQLTTTPDRRDVKVTVSDGVVLIGKLPVGTRMISAGGAIRRVGADESLGYAMTNPTLTLSYELFGGGVVLAVAAAVAAPGRRRRLAATRSAEARSAMGARAVSSWAAVAALPYSPPIVPARPVLLPPRPPRPAPAASGPPSVAGQGRLLPPAGEVAVAAEAASPPPPPAGVEVPSIDDVARSATDVARADGEAGHRWSGPAVLLLGPVMVVGWAVEPERRIVAELAAYLACHQERPRTAEEIHAAVWPLSDSKADVSLDTVRQHLSRLRRALGESHLPDASKAGGYRLASTVSSDWFRFQALAEAARRVDVDRAVTIGRDALGLVRGAPFAGAAKGTCGWAWEELIVAGMEAAVTNLAHRTAQLCLAAGNPTQADWAAGRSLLAVPTEETLLADRLEAAFAAGGHGRLERAWRDTRSILGEQADTGPLAAVHARLRQRA